jgi:AraC-like DNA-binding protein
MIRPRTDAPRGVLNRQPERGRFAHERFLPSPALAPYVEHFWSVRWDLRGEQPFVAETLPHPSVHVLFERGPAQVAGLHRRKFTRRLRGEGRVFAIKFRPAAFRPVLGAPLSRITGRVISLRAVLGARSAALTRAILAEQDVKRCAALAEDFLVHALPPLPREIAQLRDLVERLARDPGITRVEQAAALLGTSLRTMQRRFLDSVGVSPKWVIQRYRLHEAAAQLSRADAPELADLALQLGYFDQSHFTRDFKAVVGCAPGDYGARRT